MPFASFPISPPAYPQAALPGYPQMPAPGTMAFPAVAQPVRPTQPSPGWQATPPSPVLAAQAAALGQPKARGAAPEAPATTRPAPAPQMPRAIRLASPKELGVAVPGATVQQKTPLDWNETLAKLQRLGVHSFHVDQIAGGGIRATLLLPNLAAGGTQRIETSGADEGSAMRAALQQAELMMTTAQR